MSKKFKDMKDLEEYLYQTVPIAAQELVDETEISNDVHVSEEFDKRMHKYFKRMERKSKVKKFSMYAKRVCAIFIVFAIAAGASLMSVEAWRIKLFNMLTEKSETNTQIQFNNEEDNKFVSEDITLDYLPSGFKLSENKINEDIIFLSFTKGVLHFDLVCRSVQSTMRLDTEDADSKNIKINESDAVLSIKNGNVSLIWSDGLYSYSIVGNLTEEEVIKIANNVKK